MTGTAPRPAWRRMVRADLAAVASLEAACHAPLPPEGEALFAERLSLFPAGCLAAEDGSGFAGYLVAHPWRLGAAPALGQSLGALPDAPDCLHLHDIALAPRVRGAGLVAAAVAHLVSLARGQGLARLSLVAVHGTAPLWARHGFVALGAASGGYGEAVAMRRDIPEEAR